MSSVAPGSPVRYNTRMSVQESSKETRQPAEDWLLEAVLQALPMQLAVLDQDGTIVFVNAAWDTFARENGAALAETSVGTVFKQRRHS